MKTIFKHTLVCACAIAATVACSKKDASSAAVDGGSLSQCPEVADVKSNGQEAYYAMQNDAQTPARTLRIARKEGPNNQTPFVYELSFGGNETVQIDGTSRMQPVGPTTSSGQSAGSLKANCAGGRFVVAGNDADGKSVSMQIETKASNDKTPGLLVNIDDVGKAQFLESTDAKGIFVTSLQKIASVLKNGVQQGQGANGQKTDIRSTGIPTAADFKQ